MASASTSIFMVSCNPASYSAEGFKCKLYHKAPFSWLFAIQRFIQLWVALSVNLTINLNIFMVSCYPAFYSALGGFKCKLDHKPHYFHG